jgi:hypothetical protein
MDRMFWSLIFIAAVQSTSLVANAAEPAFCDPATFKNYEVTPKSGGLYNAHMFKIGSVTLVGLAVGDSTVSTVQKLAADYGRNLSDREKSCTWYLNDGNQQASQAFVHRYVDRPNKDINASVTQYMSVLGSSFDQEAISVVSCTQDHGYMALGCDGMKHRGPTYFAMVLSFAGCSADHSVAIANAFWGTNGIPTPTRVAIAQSAYDLGTAHSDARQKIQAAFLHN